MAETHPTRPREKALKVNLDPRRYGTFAEIGAGQEVVRWFFRAGGAAGTIAKSISAYDMTVSDAIYGPCSRYVCRERLESMLAYEQGLNLERLSGAHGHARSFFTFADTVSAKSFRGNQDCHGWLGIRFQAHPRDESSQIIVHVRLLDAEAAQQQEALGIFGVNLVYGACFYSHDPEALLRSLLDGLSTDRIEVDMIEFSGIEFRYVDNRIMSLRLVEMGLSDAAMFAADGPVLQPSEVLYQSPVLIERGSFRPVTYVNLDMLECALENFRNRPEVVECKRAPVAIMEITMRNLMADGELDLSDFLARAEVLAATGQTVLISNFSEYYRLAAYIARHTDQRIGIAMGAHSLREVFGSQYYEDLEGGVLEGMGRLFRRNVELLVYPHRNRETEALERVDNLQIDGGQQGLFRHLVEHGLITQLENANLSVLDIYSRDVLTKIREGDETWEAMVPATVAEVIRSREFFGYKPGGDREPRRP